MELFRIENSIASYDKALEKLGEKTLSFNGNFFELRNNDLSDIFGDVIYDADGKKEKVSSFFADKNVLMAGSDINMSKLFDYDSMSKIKQGKEQGEIVKQASNFGKNLFEAYETRSRMSFSQPSSVVLFDYSFSAISWLDFYIDGIEKAVNDYPSNISHLYICAGDKLLE